jgi:transmembrane sensor
MAVLETMPKIKVPLKARFGPMEWTPVQNLLFSSSVFRRFRSLGLAAAVVLVLAGGWFLAARMAGHEDYSNPEAVAQRVKLRDGSVVHLNTGSELRVDFSAGERRVRLQSGEAYFEVAHDASRPFVVVAGGVVVRAIGTAFNIRLASANVEVLVEEGRVEVAPVASAPIADGAPVVAAPQLGAGERTQVPRTDAMAPPKIERVERRELREALAWHRQTVVLADIALEDVIARFNRRNEVQLVLADAELRGRRVGGVLFLDQVEAFVTLLERGGDIVAERRGSNEIVLRRTR